MGLWLRRVRAALAMGFIWAVGGLLVGGLLELIDNVLPAAHPVTRLVDMWPQALAMLGFPLGILFAIVLGLVGSRRRFEQFSFAEFTGLGTLAGVVLGVIGMALGAGPFLLVVTTLLAGIGGASSLALARMAESRGLLSGGAPAGSRELLGRHD